MWGTITGLYIVCLAIGFIYSLIGAIFGELGSHGDAAIGDHGVDIGGHDVGVADHGVEAGDHGIEAGGHDFTSDGSHVEMSYAEMQGLHVSPLNTITIATFVGSFGAMGLIGQWGLGLQPLASLAFAVPTALVAAGVQFYLYTKVLVGSSASSEATANDVLSCEADVVTGIPENGVGEITYTIKGFRYTAPARSVDGRKIIRGSRVRIVRSAAGVMQVREF